MNEQTCAFSVMSSGLREIISDVGYFLDEMSQGNFLVSTRCSERYVGEYENILTSAQNINTKLSDTLNQINRASDQVSAGAQALSQGATEQASSVEELAATINEISGQVKETAENGAVTEGYSRGSPIF